MGYPVSLILGIIMMLFYININYVCVCVCVCVCTYIDSMCVVNMVGYFTLLTYWKSP